MIDHKRHFVGFPRIFLLAILILSILKGTIDACPLELPKTSVSINGHHLIVEVAATPQSRKSGLSKRSTLDGNQGILFAYPRSGLRTFWMRDTWIPLSIAFLDESGIILNIEIMSPDQTGKRYRSSRPAVYALEVNQGWFRSHGIKAGGKVEMREAGIIGGANEMNSGWIFNTNAGIRLNPPLKYCRCCWTVPRPVRDLRKAVHWLLVYG